MGQNQMEDLKSLTPEEFKDLEVDESEKSEAEKPAEESTPKEPDESNVVKKEEERVPYSRFEEVNEQLKSVKAEVEALKSTKSERTLTAEEQGQLEAKTYLKNLLTEVLTEKESEKAAAEKKAEEEFNTEVKRLGEIYQDFDEDKVVKYANKNSIDDLEKAYLRMKIAAKPATEVPKPKVPKAESTADTVLKEKVTTSGLDMYEAVRQAKEKLGIK